jgi:hypothetical protein
MLATRKITTEFLFLKWGGIVCMYIIFRLLLLFLLRFIVLTVTSRLSSFRNPAPPPCFVHCKKPIQPQGAYQLFVLCFLSDIAIGAVGKGDFRRFKGRFSVVKVARIDDSRANTTKTRRLGAIVRDSCASKPGFRPREVN